MEALIGSTLGSHKLTAPLGTGTTGQCFAAVDGSGAPATVKVLHPALSLFTKVEGYWDELQKVGTLSHPHIVAPVAADWSKSGRFYLVSDPLDGVDLHAALAQHGRLPPSQVLLFAGQVCLALEAAHGAGHVHGAVKPHNIFLVRRGTEPSGISTRLLDFATGRLVGGVSPGSGTPGGPGVPDPAYLAPEQFKGPATPASDLYALGVILYEALSGRRPFVGSYEQLAKLHAAEAPLPPANIPVGLREVVLKALSKDPKNRYADAGELLAAIEGWAASSPTELEQAGVSLFAKAEDGTGVAQGEGEQTVKVAIDELSLAVEDRQPDSEREVLVEPPVGGVAQPQSEKKKQPMADAKSSKPAEPTAGTPTKAEVPQDHELAAIAEKAVSSLRTERLTKEEKATPPPAKPAPEVEAYFDEDDELVELPLEKSVKAFVATLSPIVAPPTRTARPGGNGESLDAALDQFVRDAKAMSAVLPPPVMDDRRLAQLAKIPVEEPPPPVAPVAPVAPSVVAPVAPVGPAPIIAERSILVPSVLSFLIGGALVFGAYKLFLEKPPTVDGAGGASTGATIAPPPGVDKKAPAATPLVDGAGASAARTLDAGGSAAAARPDGAPAAAGTTPDAAPTAAATPDAAAPTPTPKKAVKKAGKKAGKKAIPAVAKKKVEPKVKAKKDKKDKKGGSDWVDPFSQ